LTGNQHNPADCAKRYGCPEDHDVEVFEKEADAIGTYADGSHYEGCEVQAAPFSEGGQNDQ